MVLLFVVFNQKGDDLRERFLFGQEVLALVEVQEDTR
jgi:hypothetical protein